MKRVCGECSHFRKLNGGRSGECYALPPAAFPGGFHARPVVGLHDLQCGHFTEAPHPASLTVAEVKRNAKTITTAALQCGLAKAATAPPASVPRGKRG